MLPDLLEKKKKQNQALASMGVPIFPFSEAIPTWQGKWLGRCGPQDTRACELLGPWTENSYYYVNTQSDQYTSLAP